MISTDWIFLYTLIPMGVAILGGLVATFYAPNATILNALQHFIAGIVIGAVSIELLPQVLASHFPWALLIAFVAGLVFMFLLQIATQSFAQKKTLISLIAGGALDLFIDGVLIGISFVAGEKSGFLIAFSLCFCAFFLNLTLASTLAQHSKNIRLLSIFLVAAMLPIGAFLAVTVIAQFPSSILVETIAFGVAALLYLGIEELLAESHKKEEAMWVSACFFIGFLVILSFKLLNAL